MLAVSTLTTFISYILTFVSVLFYNKNALREVQLKSNLYVLLSIVLHVVSWPFVIALAALTDSGNPVHGFAIACSIVLGCSLVVNVSAMWLNQSYIHLFNHNLITVSFGLAIVTCVLGKYHLHYTGQQEPSTEDYLSERDHTDIKNAPEWLTWFMIVVIVLLFISWLLSFMVIQTIKRKDDPSVELEMNITNDGDSNNYGEGDLEQFKHNFDMFNHNNYSDQSDHGSNNHMTPADATKLRPVTNIVDGRIRYERDVV
ncbi:unnamed protein product [Ambrosiozyma monospora]|uniref:Unnamed protein product n=1 Tax=Ambrosiozyma monospora TaxID=43982 RepID=A0ACB5T1P9_AMBMO|nr:unnamed protein product [Ambrosiozyma monospora]